MKLLWNCIWSVPNSSIGKESSCNAGDLGSIPGLGRSPGEEKGYPLQYSGLENSKDCIPWCRKESDTTERLSLSRLPSQGDNWTETCVVRSSLLCGDMKDSWKAKSKKRQQWDWPVGERGNKPLWLGHNTGIWMQDWDGQSGAIGGKQARSHLTKLRGLGRSKLNAEILAIGSKVDL